MSERTMEKARQVVHRLSEWYFAEGGDNDPDSPIDREDLDALHELVRRTPGGEGEAMDADAMWYHWSSGHEDAALLGLRTASDDEAHRFLDMLARWQKCPKPSDHDAAAARTNGGSDV